MEGTAPRESRSWQALLGMGWACHLWFYFGLGLLMGGLLAYFLFVADRGAVRAAEAAETEFLTGAAYLQTLGPRFGDEDYLRIADERFQKACRLARPGQRMEERVGLWLAERGYYAEAVPYLTRAVRKHADWALAIQLGKCAAVGRSSEGVKVGYTTAIRLRPNDALAYNSLGYYYAVEGTDLGEAERLVKQAIRLAGRSSRTDVLECTGSLAWVYYRQGRLGAAWRTISEVARVEGQLLDPVIREHYDAIRRAVEERAADRAPGNLPEAPGTESSPGSESE